MIEQQPNLSHPTHKELRCFGKDQFSYVDYDEPVLQAGEVRVHNDFGAAKHGTEMVPYKGKQRPWTDFDHDYRLFLGGAKKVVPAEAGWAVGNMNVGHVVEVANDVDNLRVGDRVLAYGKFRQTQVSRASSVWKVPEALSWKSAVCLDPADFACCAVRDGLVRVGDTVAVFGMGAIGLMVVQLARLSGASAIFAVDPLANRRKAASTLGVDGVLDPTACDVGLEIKKATGKRGVDVAIDYSGSRQALQDELRAVAFGGNIVCGAYPPPYSAGLDFGTEAHFNRPNIIFSRANSDPNREHPRWDNQRLYDTCLKLILEGRLTGEPIVDPVVAFKEAGDAYAQIATDPGSNIKLGVRYG